VFSYSVIPPGLHNADSWTIVGTEFPFFSVPVVLA
jgi:hypothetical protein